ncbi:MAG: EAL domain-containing protein [Cyanobacteria bacterium P01_F01_bin.150]
MISPFIFHPILSIINSPLEGINHSSLLSLTKGEQSTGLWLSLIASLGISAYWWKKVKNYRPQVPHTRTLFSLINQSNKFHYKKQENESRETDLSSSKISLENLKILLLGLPYGAVLLNPDNRILLANPEAIHLLKLTTHQLQGHSSFSENVQWFYPNGECCPAEDHPVYQAIQTGQPAKNITLGIGSTDLIKEKNWISAHESICWVWISAQPQLSLEGSITHIVCTIQDITKHQNQQILQNITQQRHHYFFEHTPIAMIEWDANFKVCSWNRAATSIFGYSRTDALEHHVTELIVPSVNVALMNELWHRLLVTKETSHNANENITQAGERILCEWYHTPILNDAGEVIGITSMAQDVTEKQEIEQRLIYNAFHDSLTGLPNRSLFMRKLEGTVKKYRTQRTTEKTCGVFFIDLDGFKFVNDSLGHSMGDSLLVEVAARLSRCIRDTDLIARLGGDEFAILLDQMKSPDAVLVIAERMRQDLTRPFNLHGHEVFTGVSIGIALMQSDIASGEVLLRNADTAMYRAKEAGKSCYRVFTPDMYAKAVSRLEMESDLRKALERDEFELHYQPILSLRNRLLFGFEALVRWRHPEKGLVSPGEFIPIAEETGFIKALGQWVLEEACQQTHQWHKQFPAKTPLIISVNLSAKQFSQPNLADKIRQTLHENQLPPQYLKLEITESILMGHANSATVMIDELKELGVKFAIDDFGTGYSSLGYLHRFSVDTLKIDRSFIRSLDTDVEKIELVRTILSLAWNLGMDVVAEGIETKKHLAQLRLLKCDYGQGYFFAKPLSQGPATELLKKSWSGEYLQLLESTGVSL